MSKKPQKRRPEIMYPGRKLLTPLEKRDVEKHIADNQERWKYLLSLNKWEPAK